MRENVPIIEVVEVVFAQCSLADNQYQQKLQVLLLPINLKLICSMQNQVISSF